MALSISVFGAESLIDHQNRAIAWIKTNRAHEQDSELVEQGEEVLALRFMASKLEGGERSLLLQMATSRAAIFLVDADRLTATNKEATNAMWLLPTYILVVHHLHDVKHRVQRVEPLVDWVTAYATTPHREVYAPWNIQYLSRLGATQYAQLHLNTALSKSRLYKEIEDKRLLLALKRADPRVPHNVIEVTANDIFHEIFGLTAFGELPPNATLVKKSPSLTLLLSYLLEWALLQDSLDFVSYTILAAEMLSLDNLSHLGLAEKFLRANQNADGSFGATGKDHRHTTLLASMAISCKILTQQPYRKGSESP